MISIPNHRYEELLDYDGWEYLSELREFIAILRSNGYDELFRVGTSMHRLIFSRSVNHGLRKDQKSILIEAYSNGIYDIRFYDFTAPGELIRIYNEFTTDHLIANYRLVNLLKKLANTLVD